MPQWKIFPPQVLPEKRKTPWVLIILAYVVVISLSLMFKISTWPDNKHVDGLFFFQGIIFPFLIVTTITLYSLMFWSAPDCYFENRKDIEEWELYYMRKYAWQHLVIAGWSSLAPLDNIALQMLKLEGEFPLAPKTPLRIETNGEFEATRTQQILTRLIAPLAAKLKQYPDFNATIWLRDGDETLIDELRIVLEQQGTQVHKINFLTECPHYSLLNEIITEYENEWQYRRLLIFADLYGDEDNKCMESATALFICKEFPHHERPKPVYLYQPLTGDQEFTESVPVFLATAQTAVPKTLWYTGLTQIEKYPLMSALGESKAASVRLELETSLGECSAGYRWLALALAADAAQYAQGAQLVAASEKNQPGLIALSSSLPEILSEPRTDSLPFSEALIPCAMFSALITGFLGWVVPYGEPNWLVVGFAALFIVCISILIPIAILVMTHKDALRDMQCLMK